MVRILFKLCLERVTAAAWGLRMGVVGTGPDLHVRVSRVPTVERRCRRRAAGGAEFIFCFGFTAEARSPWAESEAGP